MFSANTKISTYKFYPEDDPRGSKHVTLINTENLFLLTVLVYTFIIQHNVMSALNQHNNYNALPYNEVNSEIAHKRVRIRNAAYFRSSTRQSHDTGNANPQWTSAQAYANLLNATP